MLLPQAAKLLPHRGHHCRRGSCEAIEDAIQEAVARYIAEVERGRLIRNPMGYIYTTLRNIARSERRRPYRDVWPLWSGEDVVGPEPDPLEVVTAAAELAEIRQRLREIREYLGCKQWEFMASYVTGRVPSTNANRQRAWRLRRRLESLR
jgi:DNA-directed RNA polymerase specialized sigma24 family protein